MNQVPGNRAGASAAELQGPRALDRETRLEDLRAEIDDLDDRIHRLLMRRAEVAARVGESKRAQAGGGLPLLFRPAREAQVLRRLLDRHRGRLPRAVLQDVWRGIIAGSLALQDRTVVAATPGVASRLARDHFRSCVPLQEIQPAEAALDAVAERRAAMAVLPFPGDVSDPGSAWWPTLRAHPFLHIVGQVPLLRAPSAPTAALVAGQPPEASGDDRTLILTPSDAGPAGAADSRVVAVAGGAMQLLALEGFVPVPPNWAGPEARIAGVVAVGVT